MQKKTKTISLMMRISDQTAEQLAELVDVLSDKAGTQISKTQAVEMAINFLLDELTIKPKKTKLI